MYEEERIKVELSRYWGKVFGAKKWGDGEKVAYDKWLEGLGEEWKMKESLPTTVNRKEVAMAIKYSGNSAPGPDGIPYAAYRALGSGAVDILHGVAAQLVEEEDFIDYLDPEFNHSILVCLPKKPSGQDDNLQNYYALENTRPLSIVDTANRLIASCIKLTLHDGLERWVSEAQQGFLNGRSMYKNILEMDKESKVYSIEEEDPVTILMDIKAAFPSVSHDFMFHILEWIGLPAKWIKAIKVFYHNNLQMINNRKDLGFVAEVRIRQGCPLSPLIFAVIADPFLRLLKLKLGRNGLIRAFADDNGLTLRKSIYLQTVLEEYKRYEVFSNLKLNLKKCYVIPLFYTANLEKAKSHILKRVERAREMSFAWYAIYLGIYLGPGAGEVGWEAPILKYFDRARQWGGGDRGIFVAARHYAIYCVSVLQFYLQFYPLNQNILQYQDRAFRKFFSGPGNWIGKEEVWWLTGQMGMKARFSNLQQLSLASRMRMLMNERALKGKNLQEPIANNWRRKDEAPLMWHKWYDHGILGTIYAAREEGHRLGITEREVRKRMDEDYPMEGLVSHGDILKQQNKRRKATQRTILKMIEEKEMRGNPKLAKRVRRWRIGGNEVAREARLMKRLEEVNKDHLPRVASSFVAYQWNGLGTCRRWQREGRCVMCRGEGTWDSIEHYAHCPATDRVARKIFNLHPPETICKMESIKERLECFLLLDGREDKEERDKHYLYLYTIYRLQNLCRHEEDFQIVGGGWDWHCKHYLNGILQAKGCSRRIKNIVNDLIWWHYLQPGVQFNQTQQGQQGGETRNLQEGQEAGGQHCLKRQRGGVPGEEEEVGRKVQRQAGRKGGRGKGEDQATTCNFKKGGGIEKPSRYFSGKGYNGQEQQTGQQLTSSQQEMEKDWTNWVSQQEQQQRTTQERTAQKHYLQEQEKRGTKGRGKGRGMRVGGEVGGSGKARKELRKPGRGQVEQGSQVRPSQSNYQQQALMRLWGLGG